MSRSARVWPRVRRYDRGVLRYGVRDMVGVLRYMALRCQSMA